MLNNNQNTTYNFGRDVINNNPVTNVVNNNPVTIYLTEAEVCFSSKPLSQIHMCSTEGCREADQNWYVRVTL